MNKFRLLVLFCILVGGFGQTVSAATNALDTGGAIQKVILEYKDIEYLEFLAGYNGGDVNINISMNGVKFSFTLGPGNWSYTTPRDMRGNSRTGYLEKGSKFSYSEQSSKVIISLDGNVRYFDAKAVPLKIKGVSRSVNEEIVSWDK